MNNAGAKLAPRFGFRTTVIVVVGLAAAGGAPQAAPAGEAGERWAMTVGVNEYADQAIPALQYCGSDVRLLARCLSERCGYAAERIVLITDDQANTHLRPLRRNVLTQLETLLNKAVAG